MHIVLCVAVHLLLRGIQLFCFDSTNVECKGNSCGAPFVNVCKTHSKNMPLPDVAGYMQRNLSRSLSS
jgi:hypothetical protein